MAADLATICEYLSLSERIEESDLRRVNESLNQQQNEIITWTDPFDNMTSEKAKTCRQVEILKKLLLKKMMMSGPDMVSLVENDTYYQSIALDIAAGAGHLEKVEMLYRHNDQLLRQAHVRDHGLAIPVVRASNAGHGDVTRYILRNTTPQVLMHDNGYWATCLLLDAIFYGFLDIALDILQQERSLAVIRHEHQRSTPLRYLALKPDLFRSYCDLGFWRGLIYSCINLESETWIRDRHTRLVWMTMQGFFKWFGIKQVYEFKDRHHKAQNLLEIISQGTAGVQVRDEQWKESVYESLIEAVENGNKEFFMKIIKSIPPLLWITEGDSGRNLFHLAVKFKKEKIFCLIHGLGDDKKLTLLRSYDNRSNNILHMAARLSPSDQLSKVSGSALKMQRDAQWYKEVKSLVSEQEVVQKNADHKTPRQVFEESHESLRKEGEELMKYTATACSFVAALVATVTFQAIFTVPGGSDESSGKPLLLYDGHFVAFIIIDAIAFFASCISVLIFLSILTSRYSFDDFISSLPKKMIFGLSILSFSITAMLVAFITSVSATMRHRPQLIIPMKPVASLPGLLFMMLLYPLLKEMISSTYGKGLFHRDTKIWL